MKKTKFLWAAALIIALVAMLTACPADEGLSLPSYGDLSKVQAFDKKAPVSENEALDLLNAALSYSVRSTLSNLNSQAFNNAFIRQENMSYSVWYLTKIGETKASISVSFKEGDNSFTNTNYNGVKITGSSKGSFSSNRTFGEIFSDSYVPKKDDTYSISSSFNKTADFSNTKLTYSSWSDTYEVYGILKVEGKSSSKYTVKELETDTTAVKAEQSSSSTEKVSAVFSVSDGTKSAKFKLSSASEYSSKNRQANSSNESIESDIEVFDNAGGKLFTIRSDVWLSNLVSCFDDF